MNTVIGMKPIFLVQKSSPSIGVTAVMGSLVMGASNIFISGFSLRTAGLSYSSSIFERKHVNADRRLLKKAVRHGNPIFALEEEFAVDAGLQLWQSNPSHAVRSLAPLSLR